MTSYIYLPSISQCTMRPVVRLLRLLSIAMFFLKSFAVSIPGRKSTAREVYAHLKQNSNLAPYVAQNGGGTVVVTGGNSGIGVETVRTLAQAGLNVVLCARNVEGANEVKKSLSSSEQERVRVQYIDLSNLSSVRKATEEIISNHKKIDCILNNAGIMAIKTRQTTTDGIEKQFGTNHVGHHYFTRLLLPSLNKNGRIVTVASTAHTMASSNCDWESNTKYTPWSAYGNSKLSNILFAKGLQDKMNEGGKGIKSVSLHPGVINSPLWKHSLPSFMRPLVGLIANKNVEQGAATNVYCALARNVEGGAYYEDCGTKEPDSTATNVDNRNKLWEYTENILANKGFAMPSLTKDPKLNN